MTPTTLLASLQARGAIGAGLVRDPDGTERVAGVGERLVPVRDRTMNKQGEGRD